MRVRAIAMPSRSYATFTPFAQHTLILLSWLRPSCVVSRFLADVVAWFDRHRWFWFWSKKIEPVKNFQPEIILLKICIRPWYRTSFTWAEPLLGIHAYDEGFEDLIIIFWSYFIVGYVWDQFQLISIQIEINPILHTQFHILKVHANGDDVLGVSIVLAHDWVGVFIETYSNDHNRGFK